MTRRRVAEASRPPGRAPEGHKGSFGSVEIIAGEVGMFGAAILAARGALRGGAGLVRAALPRELMAPFTVAVPAAMTRDRQGLDPDPAWPDVLVCGPGLRPDSARRFTARCVADTDLPCVLDAGALHSATLSGLPLGARHVLTPHPGEAARLLGLASAAEVQADRRAAAEALADRYGATVVLKGAGTLVCDAERIYENHSGNAGLGTGGTGDVLAGLLGALLAQGMEPFDAASCAVSIHGRAGDRVAVRMSEAGLCAEDLPVAIAEEMRG